MGDLDDLSAKQFGASFKGFLDKMAAQAPDEEPPFLARLRAHFGSDPATLPIVAEAFDKKEQANLHIAVDAYANGEGRRSELLGVAVQHDFFGVKLAQLLAPGGSPLMGGGAPSIGPVQYKNLPVGQDKVLACVQSGLYLVTDGAVPVALMVSGSREMDFRGTLSIEVMTAERATAEAVLAGIRSTMRKRNIYRGHVISLRRESHQVEVDFHRLPEIGRDDIILPEGLLGRVERLTIKFSEHREKLAAAKRHLKRGLLLYGPPGTGKTLTAMYLAGRMSDRTTILLTGGGLGLLEESCALARALQPATLILEDVDLVAEERTAQQKACNVVLFELLNQMDGLADDADLLFLLTTNRPEMLETALASRPGRIDQAIEVPLPDSTCRDRLLSLYSAGLTVELGDRGKIVERTKGASAAFIRELLRKAALFAADDAGAGGIVVRDRHFEDALYELVALGGDMTKSLLGFAPTGSATR